jgi:hypothetical protein
MGGWKKRFKTIWYICGTSREHNAKKSPNVLADELIVRKVA